MITNIFTKLSMATVGATLTALSVVGNAQAATFTEVGDAGQLLGTSQDVGSGITKITGSISADADLFKFYWNGGSFTANTFGSSLDTKLFLFSTNGLGIVSNDDTNGSQSQIAATLSQGLYYLGVSGYGYSPVSSGGLIFPGTTNGQDGPTGSGGAFALSGWSVSGDSGTYQINLSATSVVPSPTTSVPEPASVIGILGLTVFGVTSLRKRKQATAVTP